ncbi:unnamed protein product [Diatraea saccharalis]|uniref:Uncharacterized protein n=1 Tax=Diatraea saccharalis TaxID=40085 RepID=A0A9N9R7M8_9NEOP|nr:unnamed protein product [Diatraea saccharalis]
MACCYHEDCGEYAVTPMLIAPCMPTRCCDDPPVCYPCLPTCNTSQIVYCCEKQRPRRRSPACCEHHHHDGDSSEQHHHSGDSCSPHRRQKSHQHGPRQTPPCSLSPDCCTPCCKPVKTKYVIPCYRYEDGRIMNQPTVLMRRACEVAVGARERRKPFVMSTYKADATKVEHRYHSEDERGNCCYHFERKKQEVPSCCSVPSCRRSPCHVSLSCPECQYSDCVHARAVTGDNSCCFYC